ncbi:MAG: LysM peptidoglycan-binding domain-containing protein [Pseudomonadales bacterium]|nr:LysM peptidoglycan-binding domain-containing protein [Pseudomonadales bacterium]
MKKIVLGLIVSTLLSFSALAENIALAPDHPSQYEVKRGDTLWDISSTFLRDPWLWPEIWHINRQVKNPHLIYPGDMIKLVYVDGEPRLELKRSRHNSKRLSDGTIKLSPRIRASDLDSVIPAIPLDAIQSFLTDSRVLTKEQLEDAPYVVAGNENHVVMGVGDYVYARGDWNQQHSAYGMYRQGSAYIDPKTKEVLGYDAKELGLGKIVKVTDDIAKTELVRANQEIRIGDRLIPTEERKVQSVFYPKSPKKGIAGRIISVMSGVKNVAQYDVVVVNRGAREGVEQGDVFAIYRKGEAIRDIYTDELVQLPSERAGMMMVFRTFEKVSYALVLKATSSMAVLDEIREP